MSKITIYSKYEPLYKLFILHNFTLFGYILQRVPLSSPFGDLVFFHLLSCTLSDTVQILEKYT